MRSTCRLIVDVHNLPVPEDGNSGCSASDVDDSAIFDLQNLVGCGRLIEQGCDLKSRSLYDILDCSSIKCISSRRNRRCRIDEFGSEFLLEFLLHLAH